MLHNMGQHWGIISYLVILEMLSLVCADVKYEGRNFETALFSQTDRFDVLTVQRTLM